MSGTRRNARNSRTTYQSLIQLRKDNAAFRTAEVNWLNNSDDSKIISFTRADAHDEFLVIINFSNRPLDGM